MTNGHINPANVPDIALKDGHSIPQVGLGVLRIDDEGVVPVVESALEAGYRHIDGAAGYNNEAGVGRALAEAPAGLPCHRVVNSAGRTVPGWTRQRELLEAEGVRFKANGCADLARCGWEEVR